MIGSKWTRAGSVGAAALAMTLCAALPAQAFIPPPAVPAVAVLFEGTVGVVSSVVAGSAITGPGAAVIAPGAIALGATVLAVGALAISAPWLIEQAQTEFGWFQDPKAKPLPGATLTLGEPTLSTAVQMVGKDFQIAINHGTNGAVAYDVLPASHEAFSLNVFMKAQCKSPGTGEVKWGQKVIQYGNLGAAAANSRAFYSSAVCSQFMDPSGSVWEPTGAFLARTPTTTEISDCALAALCEYHPGAAEDGDGGTQRAFAPIGSWGNPWGEGGRVGEIEYEAECVFANNSQPGGVFKRSTPASASTVRSFVCDDVLPGSTTGGVSISALPDPNDPNAPKIPLGGWNPTTPAEYANCAVENGLVCSFTMRVDGNVCVAGVLLCQEWATIRETQPERLECRWGEYVVALAECNLLETAYRPGGSPGTEENTDGNPTTVGTDLEGVPWNPPKEEPRRVPVVPAYNPWDPTKPDPYVEPDQDPRTGVKPTPAPAPAPEPGTEPATDPAGDGGGTATPPPAGTGTPAFDLSKKFPINMFITIGGFFNVAHTDECPDWRIVIGTSPATGNTAGLNKSVVCDSSFTQAIRDQRPTLFFMVSVAMLMPLVRQTWRAMIPIVRVGSGS